MSDNTSFGFGKFVPGFDFLQNLASSAVKGASNTIPQLPNLGNWVAPTLNVEELDKRIEELKAVQFWLDQNAMALKATIQALEVQKMTLATLKGMNFNMGDVANAFKIKATETVANAVNTVSEKVGETASGVAASVSGTAQSDEAPKKKSSAKAKVAAPGMVDPAQWWGALTQQFQQIAATAMKDAAQQTAIDTTKNLATGLAKEAIKTATDMATGMAKSVTGGRVPTKVAAKTVAKAPAKPAAKKVARKSAR
jgi:hypothetical protein